MVVVFFLLEVARVFVLAPLAPQSEFEVQLCPCSIQIGKADSAE